jgi:dTMP kinase
MADRFEREELAVHEARRKAYLDIANADPERCVVVNAAGTEEDTASAIWDAVDTRLLEHAV